MRADLQVQPEDNMVYTRPGEPGSLVSHYNSYNNFIGGIRVAPVDGEYFDSISSVDCRP